jgi:hypothetical protein
LRTEIHGAETKIGDAKTAAAEVYVFHEERATLLASGTRAKRNLCYDFDFAEFMRLHSAAGLSFLEWKYGPQGNQDASSCCGGCVAVWLRLVA